MAVARSREDLVAAACQQWAKALTDISRNNKLLHFKDLKRGTLDLTGLGPEGLAPLLSGKSLDLRAALGSDASELGAQLTEIHRTALANHEEKGLDTLQLVIGLASWPAGDGGSDRRAPILLLPVEIEGEARDLTKRRLSASGDIAVNPLLLRALRVDHGVIIPATKLLDNPEAEDGSSESDAVDPAAVFERLRAAGASIRLTIDASLKLANLTFQKMAMVRDLEEAPLVLAGHPLVAALAGDVPSRASLADRGEPVDPRDLDRRDPDEDFLIFDADSSQERVVAEVLRGRSGVIQGPPGSGKSQTIANLVASLVAAGKRVLFVAEKRAALEVVQQRLKNAGLGELCLDLHGKEIQRRQLASRFRESLELIRTTPPVNAQEHHTQLVELRQRLNDHVRELHRARDPSGRTVFELEGELLALEPRLDRSMHTRLRGADLDALGPARYREVENVLDGLASHAELVTARGGSPWTNADLPDVPAANRAVDRVRKLMGIDLPRLKDLVRAVTARTGMGSAETLDDLADMGRLLLFTRKQLETYELTVFAQDLDSVSRALEPARGGVLRRLLATLFDRAYRAARRQLLLLRRSSARPTQLAAEVESLRSVRTAWRARSAQPIDPGADEEALASLIEEVSVARSGLAAILPQAALGKTGTPVDLEEALRRLIDHEGDAYIIPTIRKGLEVLNASKLGPLLEELKRGEVPADKWGLALRIVYARSCLERAFADSPSIPAFSRTAHESARAKFQQLDALRLDYAKSRVKRAHAERAVAVMSEHREQGQLVKKEAQKKSRHLPLRRLLEEAPEVVTALRPCWMASPLAISQLLPRKRCFDVVIFDEASQVLPQDAVPALIRAEQAVVAGDKHQLPPTTFFSRETEDEEDAEDYETLGYESVLDQLSSFFEPWWLEWHYRSRDESLIAFANYHIYGNRIVTFPSAGGEPVLSHVEVDGIPRDGDEESASAEVLRVVELVLEHATKRPNETLGVITMGIEHKRRVESTLDRELENRPELQPFFSEVRAERFFVKNLERVQGDERDAILLTIGYGKDRTGRLPHRFGPLLQEGGERRLNVAITRARSRMTIVSSFGASDIDVRRAKGRGVELLRNYLTYADSGGRHLGDGIRSSVAPNAFEHDVADALGSRGIDVVPQWGVSRYRIDLVARHPKRPGEFVLAIECDGATYHSSPTARERDRLRQKHLEDLGWRFLRIWSTDWFQRRTAEIERAVEAYRQAIAQADRRAESHPASVVSSVPPLRVALASKPERAPRPTVAKKPNIDAYEVWELDALVHWINSDGLLRDDEELLGELMRELGFARRGSRIVARLGEIITRARARS